MNLHLLKHTHQPHYQMHPSSSSTDIAPSPSNHNQTPKTLITTFSQMFRSKEKVKIKKLSFSFSKIRVLDTINNTVVSTGTAKNTKQQTKKSKIEKTNIKIVNINDNSSFANRKPSSPICSYFNSSQKYLSGAIKEKKYEKSNNYIEKGSYITNKGWYNWKNFKLNNNNNNTSTPSELSWNSASHFPLKSTKNICSVVWNHKFGFENPDTQTTQTEGKPPKSPQCAMNKFNNYNPPQTESIFNWMQMTSPLGQPQIVNNSNVIYFQPRNYYYTFNTPPPKTLANPHFTSCDDRGCTSQHKANAEDEKKKPKKPFVEREGDWVCLSCKNWNFAFRVLCNRCHGKKPEASSNSNINSDI